MSNIQKLLDIMVRLRDRDAGCPWDREQSFATIAPFTIEEAYEVADAIAREDLEALEDELGDLLLQVVYHAQMAEEAGAFDFGDVVAAICDKLTRRHPHVFGEATVESAREQTVVWEELKHAEARESGRESLMDGVAIALPALTRAAKIGRRAARGGFDWPDRAGPRDKIDEELEELDAAVAGDDRPAIDAEVGDLLFAVVNLCRHLDVDPEASLRSANRRFERRFRHVEAAVHDSGGDWGRFGLDELEALWKKAKLESGDA